MCWLLHIKVHSILYSTLLTVFSMTSLKIRTIVMNIVLIVPIILLLLCVCVQTYENVLAINGGLL